MKYPTATLLAVQTLMGAGMYPTGGRSGEFHLPDIPEDERIKVRQCKIRKHATKRRVNKLHDRRKI